MWHFDPALRLVSRHAGTVVVGDSDGWQVTPPEGMIVGTTTIATGYLRMKEAVTVTSGEAAEVETLIVPGSPVHRPLP